MPTLFKSKHARLPSICLAIALCVAPGWATPQQDSSSATFESLARSLASKLASRGVNRILIVDLHGPDKLSLPFGAWLAGQFAAVPDNAWNPLHWIDRKRIAPQLHALHMDSTDEFDREKAASLAAALGADGVVVGSFGPAENGIGITLAAYSPSYPAGIDVWVDGKIPLTDEVSSHLQVPLDSLFPKDGIFTAGEGGVGVPSASRARIPSFHKLPSKSMRKGRSFYRL